MTGRYEDTERAQRVVRERLGEGHSPSDESIRLTAEGSRVLVEALIDPPEPNENLRSLLAKRSGGIPGRGRPGRSTGGGRPRLVTAHPG